MIKRKSIEGTTGKRKMSILQNYKLRNAMDNEPTTPDVVKGK